MNKRKICLYLIILIGMMFVPYFVNAKVHECKYDLNNGTQFKITCYDNNNQCVYGSSNGNVKLYIYQDNGDKTQIDKGNLNKLSKYLSNFKCPEIRYNNDKSKEIIIGTPDNIDDYPDTATASYNSYDSNSGTATYKCNNGDVIEVTINENNNHKLIIKKNNEENTDLGIRQQFYFNPQNDNSQYVFPTTLLYSTADTIDISCELDTINTNNIEQRDEGQGGSQGGGFESPHFSIETPSFTCNSANNSDKHSCTHYLGIASEKGCPAYYLDIVFDIIKYASIALVIIWDMIDLVGSITHNEIDMPKVFKKCMIRLVLVIVLFMLPSLIEAFMKLITGRSDALCGIR